MKKSALLIVVAMMLVAQVAKSQNFIAVQNGGAPAFYLQVDDAILNSQDGDTIYIPGGTWNLTQPINKRLNIIGVGHHPDSTNATFQTKLIGNLNLAEGASDGNITGIFLQGSILAYNDNYNVLRCRISNSIYFVEQVSNFTFIENIIGGSIGTDGSASNCSFINNIISAFFNIQNGTPFTNSVFKNNIFLASTYGYGEYCIACSFSILENNIFYGNSALAGVSNSMFNNNLFVDYDPFPNNVTNVGTNNIVGQDQNSIFINLASTVYSSDYHLQPTSPGKNAGKDGTDIGIYGGAFPWKAGSVPTNPHIQYESVSGVGEDGNIHVVVKVAAQDR
jgi:hypothetical protein